jgi:hypothetical protein
VRHEPGAQRVVARRARRLHDADRAFDAHVADGREPATAFEARELRLDRTRLSEPRLAVEQNALQSPNQTR